MPWRHRAPSPEDEFAKEVIALVHEILGLKATRLGGFALRVEQLDGTSFTVHLQNIFAEAQRFDGAARTERLRRAVLGIVPRPRPATWHDAAPLLLPAVRTASWANAAIGMGGGDLAAVPFGKPLVPFVKVLCAIDFEYSMSFATAADLAAWGVTDDEALRTASANLARIPCEVCRGGPAALFTGPDGYASSWLAVPAVLASVAAVISPSVIAVAATRDQLILVDAEHAEAVVRLLESGLAGYRTAARQLSPVPYLVGEAGIEPWAPPADHPAWPLVDKATRFLAASEYGQQQAKLDELLTKAGEDVHVAKHTLVERPDGTLWSWAAWVRQVTNGLLPQADVLVLGDTAYPKARFAVPWDDALHIAGDALSEEPGYDPPLWRHRGWPDGDTVAALRANAVPLPPPG
jgi:hypothetical protein